MKPRTKFRLLRLGALWFVVATGAAMLAYPGGTRLDPSTRGYSFGHNSLSDLGATVAGNGASNWPSAVLFVAALVPAGASLIAFFVTLFPLHREPGSRAWLSGAGCAAGVVAGLGYIGVAAAPSNHWHGLHALAANVAFRAFLVSSVLMGIATAGNPAFSRRAAAAWFSFAVLLLGFVLLGSFGPSRGTATGLWIHAVAQKAIVLATLGIVAYQSYEAQSVAESGANAERGG